MARFSRSAVARSFGAIVLTMRIGEVMMAVCQRLVTVPVSVLTGNPRKAPSPKRKMVRKKPAGQLV